MSPLSVLYLVLPLPIIFIIHEVEEIVTQHKWMEANKDKLTNRLPRLESIIYRLLQLNTKGFAIAAFEELIVLLLVTAYVLVGGPGAAEIWSATFMAFSIHLLIHVAQAVAVRGYIPGLVTTLLTLPYAYLGMQSICRAYSLYEIVIYAFLGTVIMLLNLNFAHVLGGKFK